jgi:hypothetical protein
MHGHMTDRGNFSAGAGITSMMRMTNDETLMLRFQAGSLPAFEELFERSSSGGDSMLHSRKRPPSLSNSLASARHEAQSAR